MIRKFIDWLFQREKKYSLIKDDYIFINSVKRDTIIIYLLSQKGMKIVDDITYYVRNEDNKKFNLNQFLHYHPDYL